MADIIALPSSARTCKGCGEEKLLSEYYKHASSKDGHVRKCKACYIRQRRDRKTGSIEGRLKETFQNAQDASKQKENRDLEIAFEDLMVLWKEQRGICKYSGVPMTWDDSNRYTTVSLDRIDSSQGYVQGNIALCCVMVNIMKNRMPLEHFLWWCRSILTANTEGF